MARKMIVTPRQTNEYYAMFGLECGRHQAAHIGACVRKHDVDITDKQISRALQSLKKQNLVTYTGRWDLVKKVTE